MGKGQYMREFVEISPLDNVNTWKLAEALDGIGYFDAPASAHHHLCHAGGLSEHSKNVYTELAELTRKLNLQWERPESPFLVAFLHDLCKAKFYEFSEEFDEYVILKDEYDKGHGAYSIYLCELLNICLTAEERVCIRYHMGAFTEKSEWGEYSAAVHRYPNVLWTHSADMYASQIMEAES